MDAKSIAVAALAALDSPLAADARRRYGIDDAGRPPLPGSGSGLLPAGSTSRRLVDRRQHHPLPRHRLPLVGQQLARDHRVGVERLAGVAQLLRVQGLQGAARLDAARGELGRLLVALDQGALDFTVVRQDASA